MTLTPENDDGCGWLNILPEREAAPSLRGDVRTKWLIIGAGNSGLSAALTLAEHLPDEEIMLIDAARAGEGASSRNSGYLIASTLNDGHLSDNGLKVYKDKFELNRKSIDAVRRIVNRYDIQCQWNECGKYHASAGIEYEPKLRQFQKLLDEIGVGNEFLKSDKLKRKLGTEFYRMGVHTEEGILIQPAAYARGLLDALPTNVKLYENTPVQNIGYGAVHTVKCEHGAIFADNLIIAVNGFMPSLKIKRSRVFPLLLTASMTRPLSSDERKQIGHVKEWGVLSASHMGATFRYTPDHRFMIRNTVEVSRKLHLTKKEMESRKKTHLAGLQKRFPFLDSDCIEHSWAGITCISRNNANLFEQVSDNCWVVGCYNGGGVGLSTLFGREIALRALDKNTNAAKLITRRPEAKLLPPQPFLNWGVRMKLAKDRIGSLKEN